MQDALIALHAFYGPLPLPPADPFQYVAWEIVSAKAIAARRDHAWQALRRIPALTPDALFRVPKSDLHSALVFLGPADAVADALREASGHFRRHRELASRITGSLCGAVRGFRDVPHLTAGARARGPLLAGGHAVPALDDGAVRVVARLAGLPRDAGVDVRRRARRVLVESIGRTRASLADAVNVLGHHAAHACAEQAPHCAVCPLQSGCAFAVARRGQGLS